MFLRTSKNTRNQLHCSVSVRQKDDPAYSTRSSWNFGNGLLSPNNVLSSSAIGVNRLDSRARLSMPESLVKTDHLKTSVHNSIMSMNTVNPQG